MNDPINEASRQACVDGMQLAFRALEQITMGRAEVDGSTPVSYVDDEGVSLRVGYYQSYRGEGQVEYENVTLTWEEVAKAARGDLSHAEIDQRWLSARAAREQAEFAAAQRQREAVEQSERARKAQAERERETKERAKLRELAQRYPDELAKP